MIDSNDKYIQKAKESNLIRFNNKIFDLVEAYRYLLLVNFPPQLESLLKENLEMYGRYTYWLLEPDQLHPIQQRQTYKNIHERKTSWIPGGIEERFIIQTNSVFVIESFRDSEVVGMGIILSFYKDFKYLKKSLAELQPSLITEVDLFYLDNIFKTTLHQLQYYNEESD